MSALTTFSPAQRQALLFRAFFENIKDFQNKNLPYGVYNVTVNWFGKPQKIPQFVSKKVILDLLKNNPNPQFRPSSIADEKEFLQSLANFYRQGDKNLTSLVNPETPTKLTEEFFNEHDGLKDVPDPFKEDAINEVVEKKHKKEEEAKQQEHDEREKRIQHYNVSNENEGATMDRPSATIIAQPSQEIFTLPKISHVPHPTEEQVVHVEKVVTHQATMAGIKSWPTLTQYAKSFGTGALDIASRAGLASILGSDAVSTSRTFSNLPNRQTRNNSRGGLLSRLNPASNIAGRLNPLNRLSPTSLLANRFFLFARFGSLGGWLIIGILGIFAIFILIWMFNNSGWCNPVGPCAAGGGGGGTTAANLPIEVFKGGPEQVDNGENIPFNITIGYTGVGSADVEVTDPLPGHTNYISSDGEYDANSRTVHWRILGITRDAPRVLNLTVGTTTCSSSNQTNCDDNTWNVNTVSVRLLNASYGGLVSQSNCDGRDRIVNPLGNFGDPNCEYNFQSPAEWQDKLFREIQRFDSANARYWFNTVVRCETGGSFYPNTWRDPNLVPHTPDPAGAWGLFQMGRGRNGPFDHGDVPWQLQVENAINYRNTVTRGSWGYWACAT